MPFSRQEELALRAFHLIVLASLLTLVSASCGGNNPSSPTSSSLETFTSADWGFSIAWDASETRVTKQGEVSDDAWQLELENLAGSGQSLSGREIPLQGLLDVRVVDLATPVPQSSLDEEMANGLTKTLVKQARREWETVKLVTPYEPVRINDMVFLHATFMSKSELPFWIHNEVFITTDGLRAFTIHLSADKDAWDQHEEKALGEILARFTLL